MILAFLIVNAAVLSAAQNSRVIANLPIDADQLVWQVVRNELKAQISDRTHWRYQKLEEEGDKKELREVIQTKDGTIDRLLAVNDQPLTPKQRLREDARIEKLLENLDEVREKQKQQREDGDKERKLLEMLPDGFIYQYCDTDEDLIRLEFRPNPRFHPLTEERQVFHHMEGNMWIDTKQKRLARMDGRLISDVKFLGGLLGHLKKGGTFAVRQEDVGSEHWEMTALEVRIDGRALFFKTISLREKEIRTNYQKIPDDMTLRQAAELLRKGPVSQVRQHPGSDAAVVFEQIALGDSVGRKQHFLWARDLHGVAAHSNRFFIISQATAPAQPLPRSYRTAGPRNADAEACLQVSTR